MAVEKVWSADLDTGNITIYDFEAYCKSDKIFYSRMLSVPEIPDKLVDIVVPTVRPQNAAYFMHTLKASTGLAKVYAVVGHQDINTANAWAAEGASIIEQEEGRSISWHCKVNDAFKVISDTEPEWFLIVGDDAKFHGNWYHRLYTETLINPNAKVIGTNDLSNPEVTNGRSAVHHFLNKEYIKSEGGTWDGPGIICHEGYRFGFGDTELTLVAKTRGVWSFVKECFIEHLHPAWQKAETDKWYSMHAEFGPIDSLIWEERKRVFLK